MDRRRWAFPVTAAVLVLAALLLRVYRIGSQELWIDEAYSFLLAADPTWFGPPAFYNNTPPLYHFLLRGWIALAGQTEAWLRLLSAVFGTLFVLVLIWAGREIFSPAVGLWSGAFAALAPFHIYYSQEARTYALLVLTLTLTYGLLWRALERNTRRSWLLVALSAALTLYSHYFSVLGLAPSFLLLRARPATQPVGSRWNPYLAAMGAALLLYAPWVVASFLLAPHPLDDPRNPWMQSTWEQIPPALAIPKSLEMLALGGQAGLVSPMLKQFRTLEFPGWLRGLGLAAHLGLLLWAALPWGDQRSDIPGLRRKKLWLWTWLFFPLAALWAVSAAVKPVYIVGRYDIVAFPAYALLVGLAFAKLRRVTGAGRRLAPAVATILCLSLGAKLFYYYRAPAPHMAQHTAKLLDAFVENGDVVVYTGARGHMLLYYLSLRGYRWDGVSCRNDERGRHFPCRLFPRGTERSLTVEHAPLRSSPGAIQNDVAAFIEPLQAGDGTLWVAFESSRMTADGLALPELDARFVEDLTRMGFRGTPAGEMDGVYAFRRGTEPS